MKKTSLKELLGNILHTKIFYISIVLFIFLGVSIYLGLGWSGKDLKKNAEANFNQGNYSDYELIFPYGITSDKVAELKSDGLTVEGLYSTYQSYQVNNKTNIGHIISMTNLIDTLTVISGTLPKNSNEICVDKNVSEYYNINIGDTITFSNEISETEYLLSLLKNKESAEILDSLLNTNLYNVSRPLVTSTYTVTAIATNPDYISVSYAAYGSSIYNLVQADSVFYVLEDSFNKDLSYGYNSVLIKYDELSKYNTYSNKYQDLSKEYEEEISLKANQINFETYQELSGKVSSVVTYAKQKIKDETYTLEALEPVYEKWNLKVNGINSYDVITTSHTANGGYYYVELLADIMEKEKYVLGGIFLILSIFISYVTIARLIHLQKKEIGIKKAYGFKKIEIARNYLLYGITAVLIGTIPAILLSRFMIEPILVKLLSNNFSFDAVGTYFSFFDCLVIILIIIILISLVSLLACLKILKQEGIKLLNGNEVKKTVHFGKLNKMSLFNKMIFNNLINDKTRVLSTLIGIIGCTALAISAISMKSNVLNCFNKQHEEYFSYDQIIYYDNTASNVTSNIEEVLKENNISYSNAFRTGAYLNGEKIDETFIHLIVYDDLSNTFNIESNDDSNPFNYQGIWISESIQKEFNLKVGENLELKSLDGNKTEIKVNGYFPYYSYRLMVLIDLDTYLTYYGNIPTNNVYFINSSLTNQQRLEDELSKIDGYLQTFDSYNREKEDAVVFQQIATVLVNIYVVMAIILAIFVILNLLMINIEEKKKELIIMMINGYSVNKVKRYIYQDIIILSIIGVIIGIFLGSMFGDLATQAFESKYLYLLHSFNYYAVIIGILITSILVVIISVISARKIDKFKLNDINN